MSTDFMSPDSINFMVEQAMKKISEEGYVQQVIEDRLKKTLKEVVDDAFREYGNFGKELKAHVQEELKINFKQLNLTSYNVMILNAIQDQLDTLVQTEGVVKFKEQMNELLFDPIQEIKLSDLVKMLQKEADDLDDKSSEDKITLDIDQDSKYLHYIALDENEDVRKYNCKYRICLEAETSKINSISIEGKKLDNKMIMSGMYGFDKLLFKLFVSGSKVIVDIDEDDDVLYYPDHYEDN